MQYSPKRNYKNNYGDTSNSGNSYTQNGSQKLSTNLGKRKNKKLLTNLNNKFKIFNKAYRNQLFKFIKSKADKEDFEFHYTPKKNNDTDLNKNQPKVIILKSKAIGGHGNYKSNYSN